MRRRSLNPVTLASTLLLTAALAHAADPAPGAAPPAKEGTKMEQTGKNPVVVISTSMGDIEAELYADKAPESVKNFIAYAQSGHYDGTVFHRVIKDFMIQGGGMTPDMQQKPTKAAIKNEADNGLKNLDGTLAMARTSQVDSATSQFFINVKDNAFLDHKSKTPQGYGYTVFGKVIGGMDVVEKIEKVPTGNKGMHQDVPTEPVVIKSITVK
ncbi:MAG: peptidyl-prolyl cis-trans isomerase [Deltaproteobacteria bacterium]|nr:peptidyl-prolyl cis-trans isomerase [Deltaproteobacteria bacterium]